MKLYLIFLSLFMLNAHLIAGRSHKTLRRIIAGNENLLTGSLKNNEVITPKNIFAEQTPILEGYLYTDLLFPNNRDTCLHKKFSSSEIESSFENEFAITNHFNATLDYLLPLITPHLDVVTITFADLDIERCYRTPTGGDPCRQFVCGLNMFEQLDDAIFQSFKHFIKKLQLQNILVKIAFGGDEFGNIRVPYGITDIADRIVEHILNAVDILGVDGVDLVQKSGCGTRNFRCDDATSKQLYILETLKREMPDKIISYTFPSGRYGINYPFLDILKYGHQYLDTINLFGSKDVGSIRQALNIKGISSRKLIWGIGIGCNEERRNIDDVNIVEAKDIARIAKAFELGGISIWSINRDTKNPSSFFLPPEEKISIESNEKEFNPKCNKFQTGLDTGAFMNVLKQNS